MTRVTFAQLKSWNRSLRPDTPTSRGLSFKVTEQGRLRVIGIGTGSSVVLSASQWKYIIAHGNEIIDYIDEWKKKGNCQK
jgi:hypothetical protein